MGKFLGYEACPKCRDRGADRRGDNLAIYSDGGRHCFSCGYHQYPKNYRSVISEEIRTEDKAKFPNDFTREIPSRAWKWILQYGLSTRYWQPYCGYSESQERFIITVGEPINFSIGRDVSIPHETSKPKRKWFVWGNCHERSHLFGPLESPFIVCVEDIVSAHKVGQAGYLTLPLFGTTVHDCHFRTMLHLGLPVVMWLDMDQQALAHKRATRISSIIGKPVRNIFTDNDPKSIPINEIKEILK